MLIIILAAASVHTEDTVFEKLPIQNGSVNYNFEHKTTDQGWLVERTVNGYLPNVTVEVENFLFGLQAYGGIFLVIDVAGTLHVLGENEHKATLIMRKINEGKAGSQFGIHFTITHHTTHFRHIESFGHAVSGYNLAGNLLNG